MTESNTLYSKEGFCFFKNEKNNYMLSFEMENNNINLSKIIDFNLVKLIYDLNSDISKLLMKMKLLSFYL